MNFTELQTRLSGMTRQQANELATRAGVPESTVSKIRKGWTTRPRVTTFELLVSALGKKSKGKSVGS